MNNTASLRIYVAQANPSVGALDANTKSIINHIHEADALQARLAIFPRMALTGWQILDLVENDCFLDCCHHSLEDLASATQDSQLEVIVGLPDRCNGVVYDSAAVLAHGQIVTIVHGQPLSLSANALSTRDVAGPVLLIREGYALAISLDDQALRAPDLYRALQPTIVANLESSPYYYGFFTDGQQRLAHTAQAIGSTVISANLSGAHDEQVFAGNSCVVLANGEELARAPKFTPGALCFDLPTGDALNATPDAGANQIQLKPSVSANLAALPAIPQALAGEAAPQSDDRQADELAALSMGLGEYLSHNGFTDVVLGISGGVDSALCAAIAVHTLGSQHVHGVYLPSCYSSDMSTTDAQLLCTNLGIDLRTIPIEAPRQSFTALLAESFLGCQPDVTEENLQARIRANILMALSNKFSWLLMCTGNKSESACGYSTMYGDGAGGIAILEDLFKTEVYNLCRYINANVELNGRLEAIPERILTRPPSAELRPDQKDSDSLPDYAVLDQILEHYLDGRLSIKQIIALGFAPDTVRQTIRLVNRSEFKRRQGPIGIKLSQCLFNFDRHMPLTNAFAEHII